MKLIIAVVVALFATSALAVDVTTETVVTKDGALKFKQSSTFAGLSDKEAKTMRARGNKVLDVASKNQDKKGDYTVTFTWNDEPAVETQGMKLSGVNATMRAGAKWLTDTIAESELRAKKGKNTPWGDQ